MLIRTHLAAAVLALILFVPHISNKLVFVFVVLIATLIPDVDSAFSTLGQSKIFRFLQFFVKHRGFIHSFTFGALLSVVLAFFWPTVSLAFFLGYSLHIFLDSFTREGVAPFWPSKRKSSWRLKTGGLIESSLFVSLILLDILLFVVLFWSFF